MKKIRLLFTFYKSFFVPSFLITLSCAALLFNLELSAFVYLFWFKVFTSAIFFWSVNTYKKKQYFYYQNLGLSKSKLWSFTLTLDFLLLIVFFSSSIYSKSLVSDKKEANKLAS
jgi:hypothetical protein